MPVDLALEKVLREHRQACRFSLEASSWVFASRHTARPLHPWTAERRWLLPAGRKVGIERLGWHSFRHTYSTLFERVRHGR